MRVDLEIEVYTESGSVAGKRSLDLSITPIAGLYLGFGTPDDPLEVSIDEVVYRVAERRVLCRLDSIDARDASIPLAELPMLSSYMEAFGPGWEWRGLEEWQIPPSITIDRMPDDAIAGEDDFEAA